MAEDGPDDDPYLWLEDVTGEKALDWVRERNDEAFAELATGERFAVLRDSFREALDADDRIPYVRRRGEFLYNFWQDAEHPRGLWRRTTLESYRTAEPDWELLLDVDALGREEGENWVWQGAPVLRPGYRRCLVNLSRGGADATVVREYDLVDKAFVDGGFGLPEAKSDMAWIDLDHVFVGTDFGEGSLTTSGYPRVVKRWTRGTPLEDAEVVYEGEPGDVAVHASHDPTPGFDRDFGVRAPSFFTSETYLLRPSGDLVRGGAPGDGWSRSELAGVPELGVADVVDTAPDHSDEFFLDTQSYTEPATLRRGEVGGDVEVLRQAPTRWDAAGVVARQFFATSDDGTRVPYFVVGPH